MINYPLNIFYSLLLKDKHEPVQIKYGSAF
jgi:hypothetical protein